ncbi:hypothetical protein ACFQH6_03070 [Halobacteriaceae archaeon GCM10025711]
MEPRTVRCTACDETRLGRVNDEEVTPVREECPACGGTEYEDLAAD